MTRPESARVSPISRPESVSRPPSLRGLLTRRTDPSHHEVSRPRMSQPRHHAAAAPEAGAMTGQALKLSTDQWVKQRLGGYVKYSIEERQEAVKALTADGHSERGIKRILGVDRDAIRSDLGKPRGRKPTNGGRDHKRPSQLTGRKPTTDAAPLDVITGLAATTAIRQQADRTDKREQTRVARPAPPPPPGRYRLLYADPPWQYEHAISESCAVETTLSRDLWGFRDPPPLEFRGDANLPRSGFRGVFGRGDSNRSTRARGGRRALATCERIDECKDWADKAAALASYAKQADDQTLHHLATRISARAIRRAGELLQQFENERARTDLEGAVPLQTRRPCGWRGDSRRAGRRGGGIFPPPRSAFPLVFLPFGRPTGETFPRPF